jgi:transglutaminase-like putative cysteine protease
MCDELRYVGDATTVDSTIDDLLSAGAGVCQDFAHFFLAMVRGAGWPARYVSGYLGPTDDEMVAEGESHAWVEICGADGRWVGIDPTHAGYTGVHHLSLAIGRDYGDVAPHRGVFYGEGTGLRPEVSVRVSRIAPQQLNVVRRGETLRWQHEQQQQRPC